MSLNRFFHYAKGRRNYKHKHFWYGLYLFTIFNYFIPDDFYIHQNFRLYQSLLNYLETKLDQIYGFKKNKNSKTNKNTFILKYFHHLLKNPQLLPLQQDLRDKTYLCLVTNVFSLLCNTFVLNV